MELIISVISLAGGALFGIALTVAVLIKGLPAFDSAINDKLLAKYDTRPLKVSPGHNATIVSVEESASRTRMQSWQAIKDSRRDTAV